MSIPDQSLTHKPQDNQITLTDSECFIAKYLAKTRGSNDRDAGAVNTPYAGKDQQEIDENGFGAEIAFCKLFNLSPDLTTNPRVGGFDCLTRSGKKIDVKNTEKEWDQYFVKKIKSDKPECKVDYFAWMIGKLPIYKFIGLATWDEVMACDITAPYGDGSECFVVKAEIIKRIADQVVAAVS
jgi:hypothetical protein